MFHRNEGMRIDLLYVTAPVARAGRRRGDRSRGSQGSADPVRPCPGGRRPRRARQDVRGRLGGRAVPDRGPHEAPKAARVIASGRRRGSLRPGVVAALVLVLTAGGCGDDRPLRALEAFRALATRPDLGYRLLLASAPTGVGADRTSSRIEGVVVGHDTAYTTRRAVASPVVTSSPRPSRTTA